MNDQSEALRFVDRYPDLGTGPIPVSVNTSEEYFEREREKIFKKSWWNVGRAEEIARTGDYLVHDIEAINISVLVIRGEDNALRAFHNICQHRGNKLVTGERGNVRGMVCGFHSWTYDFKGDLVHVPDEDQFYEGFDPCKKALKPVTVDVWNGFVFIHPEAQPKLSLHETMGELNDLIGDFDYDDMELVAEYSADVKCNWKYFIDAFVEAYHVESVHRRSLKTTFNSQENPYCHLVDVRLHERNRSVSIYGNPDHKLSGAEAIAFRVGATLGQGALASTTEIKGTNFAGEKNWAFDIHIVFPCFEIATSNGWYFTYHWWPVSHNRTGWVMKFYMKKTTNLAAKVSQELTKALTRDTLREDLSTLENGQAMMETGHLDFLTFSDQEIAVRHGYKVVEQLLKA
jgi:phenylpropionate dioxygenase-like ring-hydroxylating dioxygenase large terminal subunit